jgi:hypothetical protein
MPAIRSLLVVICIAAIASASDDQPCGWAYESDVSTNAFLNYYWVNQVEYLIDQFVYSSQQRTGLTGYWTFAQGFDTILDAAERNSSYSNLF